MNTHTNLESIVGSAEDSGHPTHKPFLGGMGRKIMYGGLALLMGATMAACVQVDAHPIIDGTPTAKTQKPTIEQTYTPGQPTGEATYLPTETATLEATPTYTLEPTATNTVIPTLVIPDLNPYLTGVGEHGAMICLNPTDDSQLDQLVLKANISQNGTTLDKNITAEIIEGNGSCFEAIDAKYQVGTPVSVEVNATATGKQVENGTQLVDVGNFDWFPFLNWIYGDSPLNTNPSRIVFPNPTHPNAYDLQPINTSFPDGLNHPVYSPCDGQIIRYEYVDFGGNNQFHNLLLYCENTGYIIQLGHMESILKGGMFITGNQTISILVGEEIGKLVMDPVVGYVHNHTKLMRPLDLNTLNTTCNATNIEKNTCSQIIDFFNPTITTNQGTSPPFGLWISDSLPNSTQEYIQSGKIQPLY